MIELTLPRPPSANRIWRIGNNKIHRSEEYRVWLRAAQWQIVAQAKRRKIEGRFKLTMIAIRPDRRRRDLDNLIKPTLDALVKAEVVKDDTLCEWIEAYWADPIEGKRIGNIIVTLEEVETDGEA